MDELYKYNIIVINLKRLNHSINCIYLYYRIEDNKVIYDYATLSSNINSLLSEFYKNLIRIDFSKKKDDDLIKLESFIKNKISKGSINISYYEYNKTNDIDVIKNIKTNGYDITLISYLWLFNIDDYINNNINYHENYDLFYILFTSTDEIMQRDINIHASDIIIKHSNEDEILCQKITPIKGHKFMYYDQLLTKTGKQLIIMNKCNKLIENKVCINLSKLMTYMLIYNTDDHLFNNISLKNKLIESNKYKEIENRLQSIREDVNEINVADSKAKMRETMILRNVNNVINYINKTIIYSPYSISYVSRYCGPTLFDTIKNSETYAIKKEMLGDILHDMIEFDKFMFQIIYTLYSLNLSGIIHSDLHLNNITIDNKGLKEVYYDISKDSSTTNAYKFNDIKSLPCIIDFDRSYVLIDEFPILHEKHRELYINYEKKRFDKQIEELLINTKMKDRYHFKKYYKREYFTQFFINYSAYDINSLVSNILSLVDKEKLDIDKSIEAKLQDMFSYSFKYIEDILFDNIDSNNNIDYPNLCMLNEFFGQYKYNNVLPKQESNIFRISNIYDLNFSSDVIKKNKQVINDLIINNSSSATT